MAFTLIDLILITRLSIKSTTNFLIAAILIDTLGAGITAAAGTSLALHYLFPIFTRIDCKI